MPVYAHCLHHGCGRFPKRRGLCLSHYDALRARIARGETTWSAEEQAKACLPANRAGQQTWGRMPRHKQHPPGGG